MSQHSLMTTQERKLQAAAICREIKGPDDPDMDLGRKLNAPKEIMLEELSLASNRGSRLFKMRQKRSEKYTFESIQNATNTDISDPNCANTPELKFDTDGDVDQSTKTPPNTPDPRSMADPNIIAPGYGGPLKNLPAEKFNCTAIPKSYHTPWEQAIINNPSLADTLVSCMPDPEPKQQAPGYKSFNRVATPFGGFDKTPKITVPKATDPIFHSRSSPLPPVMPPETVTKRPTFNRTALGWVSDSAPLVLSSATLQFLPPGFLPETEDL
ncbi:myozenin-2-like [Denticeps clupeoides]|uniref:myozenin-2-like n=1 Tax=Denticeps clupeoides TaxID=299321 RepID=UPI0010A34ADF|nr:myozenin-2-like [Denticeps clupeoides]